MVLTSFGYTWLDQFHADDHRHRRARRAVDRRKVYNWRPSQRLFGDEGKETSTLWNYKAIGRYTMPVGDRLLGFVEGAERPPVRAATRACRSRATARRTCASRKSPPTVRRRCQHPRLARRQELHVRASSAGSPAWWTCSTLLNLGTVTQLLDHDRRELSSGSSAFSTRASSASASATTSSRGGTHTPARAGDQRRIALGWSGAISFVLSCVEATPHYSPVVRAQGCTRDSRPTSTAIVINVKRLSA